ncbi:MAG: ABC-type lipoprotein export system ATPase subunit [Verrucomicrobiales bacterium]|jgi:ABC-type lipoprotein export system ATPase subunit
MITCRQLSRSFGPVHAVRGVDLDIESGEFIAITGASGSGKSTLLHLIASLDAPDAGEMHVDGLALHSASDTEKTKFRRESVGIVFQFFNLMPTMTVTENVMLPLVLRGDGGRAARERAEQLLGLVGLSERATHFSHQLSGGEMQRVAIARALSHEPRLLIADEPTGNLDSQNRDRVLKILGRIHDEKLATMVVVTHEEEVAGSASRRIEMRDGEIIA